LAPLAQRILDALRERDHLAVASTGHQHEKIRVVDLAGHIEDLETNRFLLQRGDRDGNGRSARGVARETARVDRLRRGLPRPWALARRTRQDHAGVLGARTSTGCVRGAVRRLQLRPRLVRSAVVTRCARGALAADTLPAAPRRFRIALYTSQLR